MVDYLLRLMEEGQFEKALRQAEQQLIRGGMSLVELAKVNLVICRSRIGLNDPYGAVNSGSLAVKLARDLKEWDLLGRALLNLGTAHIGTRQYDQALHHFYSYFEHHPKYSSSRRYEGAIWKSIGVAHQRNLEPKRAIEALTKAQHWFTKQGADHSAFTCIHDLINTHLQMHDTNPSTPLEPVEDLLKAQKEVIRRHANDAFFKALHLQDRAAAYYHQGRLGRAMVCAMKAMEVRKGDHLLAFHCHMVLHQCTWALGDAKQALGYALAARVEAQRGRHFELEFLASQAMADVIRKQGKEVVRELDKEYQSMGIDLSRYLSPNILNRPN